MPETLLHSDVSDRILRCYYDARHELGHGFLEVVCQRALVIVLEEAGLHIETNVLMPVQFRGRQIGCFFADIVVEGAVLVEVKAVPQIESRHIAQALNYLRASNLEVGLILNFGPKPEFKRVVFANERKVRPADGPRDPETDHSA